MRCISDMSRDRFLSLRRISVIGCRRPKPHMSAPILPQTSSLLSATSAARHLCCHQGCPGTLLTSCGTPKLTVFTGQPLCVTWTHKCIVPRYLVYWTLFERRSYGQCIHDGRHGVKIRAAAQNEPPRVLRKCESCSLLFEREEL